MALTKYGGQTNIIQSLPTEPNQDGGLTDDQLKQKFDQYAEEFTPYVNDILIPEIEEAIFVPGGTVAEVHAARTSGVTSEVFSSVGTRIDNHDSQLSDIAISVKSFGAKGDGVTDDSAAIIAAINSLNKNGATLIFPQGVYLHGDGNNSRDIKLKFVGFKNLIIEGLKAKIISNINNQPITNNAIFRFENCENVVINGIEVDGRLDARTALGGDPNLLNQLNNFAFELGCKKITLNNVISRRSMMDGYGIGDSEDIRLYDCYAIECYRQGLSVANSKNLLIKGGAFNRTGIIKGTLPMCGIDLECDTDSQSNDNIIMENVTFEENSRYGVLIHKNTFNSKIINSKFKNNNYGGWYVGSDTAKNNIVTLCEFENNGVAETTTSAAIYIAGIGNSAIRNKIKTVNQFAISSSNTATNYSVDNNIIENLTKNLTVSLSGAVRLYNPDSVSGNILSDIIFNNVWSEGFALFIGGTNKANIKDNNVINTISGNESATKGIRIDTNGYNRGNYCTGHLSYQGKIIYLTNTYVALTYQNSWSTLSSLNQPLKYVLNDNNTVTLIGAVTKTTIDTTVIATLPVECRPSRNIALPILIEGLVGTARLKINVNGDINIDNPTTTVTAGNGYRIETTFSII